MPQLSPAPALTQNQIDNIVNAFTANLENSVRNRTVIDDAWMDLITQISIDANEADQIKILRKCVEAVRDQSTVIRRIAIRRDLKKHRQEAESSGKRDFLVDLGSIIWSESSVIKDPVLTDAKIKQLKDILLARLASIEVIAIEASASKQPPIDIPNEYNLDAPITFFDRIANFFAKLFANIRGWFGKSNQDTNIEIISNDVNQAANDPIQQQQSSTVTNENMPPKPNLAGKVKNLMLLAQKAKKEQDAQEIEAKKPKSTWSSLFKSRNNGQ